MEDVVILDAVRTPIGRLRGSLSGVRPDDLAAHVIRVLVDRHPEGPEMIGDVLFGCTNQAGEDNRNIARMALLLADLPYDIPGVTVNRLCGSGLEAVIQGVRMIRCGDAPLVLCGGVESMTRAPYSMEKSADGFSRRPPRIFDTSLGWRYPNSKLAARFPLESMGETAENVAQKYCVSREDQDLFALESQRRAAAAWDEGLFDAEVMPIFAPVAGGKGASLPLQTDESIRRDTSLEKLGALRPVFREDGSVTAGNSSPLNDGAAAVLLCSKTVAEERGWSSMACVLGTGAAGVEPSLMGIGPVAATRMALRRSNLEVDDLDLVELNEAFASQSLACIRELGFDHSRVNVQGGAIALGHPIGCSGARILVTLCHALRRRGARYGIATLCIGVGQGLALVIQSA
ncbi:MAG: thiolase family protein [Myxococcota bacterium]